MELTNRVMCKKEIPGVWRARVMKGERSEGNGKRTATDG